jgi:hypothetical protein
MDLPRLLSHCCFHPFDHLDNPSRLMIDGTSVTALTALSCADPNGASVAFTRCVFSSRAFW